MNNIFSLQQLSQTGDLDSNLILRQYNFNLTVRFIQTKALNPRLTQKEIAKELGYSTSSLQRYRHDLSMLSLHRIPPNKHKRKQRITNTNRK